jgi:hypothetical protein
MGGRHRRGKESRLHPSPREGRGARARTAATIRSRPARSRSTGITGTPGALSYDARTGQITPFTDDTRRLGCCIWCCTNKTGYFTGRLQGDGLLDWGDIANNVVIGGLGFDKYTNSQATAGDNTIVIAVYANDNGWGDTRKHLVTGFEIANIPGSTRPANEYWGWQWRVEPSTPFLLCGDDLDGDGLLDFSYAFWYKKIRSANAKMGPSIVAPCDQSGNPPCCSCSGIEDAYDRYPNPDFDNDPNLATKYVGTY